MDTYEKSSTLLGAVERAVNKADEKSCFHPAGKRTIKNKQEKHILSRMMISDMEEDKVGKQGRVD